jgi:hypothetical protein
MPPRPRPLFSPRSLPLTVTWATHPPSFPRLPPHRLLPPEIPPPHWISSEHHHRPPLSGEHPLRGSISPIEVALTSLPPPGSSHISPTSLLTPSPTRTPSCVAAPSCRRVEPVAPVPPKPAWRHPRIPLVLASSTLLSVSHDCATSAPLRRRACGDHAASAPGARITRANTWVISSLDRAARPRPSQPFGRPRVASHHDRWIVVVGRMRSPALCNYFNRFFNLFNSHKIVETFKICRNWKKCPKITK